MVLELDFDSAKRGVTPPEAPTPLAPTPLAPTPFVPTPFVPPAALTPPATCTPTAAEPAAASLDAAATPPVAAPPEDAPAASDVDAENLAKRKVCFGAEESHPAVARRGGPASPREVNTGADVDVAQPALVPATPAFTLEAALVCAAARPKRGGGGSLPAWWGREMGVLL